MATMTLSGLPTAELLASRERAWRERGRLRTKTPGHRTRESARERVAESLAALDAEILEIRGRLRYLIATELGPLSVSRMGALGALVYTREVIESLLLDDIERDTRPGEAHPWPDDATAKIEHLEAHIAAIDEELARRPNPDNPNDEGTD